MNNSEVMPTNPTHEYTQSVKLSTRLIEQLLCKVEALKEKYTNVKKKNKKLILRNKELKKELELYRDYCKNITYVKWDS